MKKKMKIFCIVFFIIYITRAFSAEEENIPIESPPQSKPIEMTEKSFSEEYVWGVESETRKRLIYPSNWGQAGIFRVRSAESLPTYTLTFGIGGEFYVVNDGIVYLNSSQVKTIAENLFVGYSPFENITFGITRRNSSTTIGIPQQLVSSLGDINLSGMYSFILNDNMVISPVINFLIASNFNEIAPAGNTLSAGVGLVYTWGLFSRLDIPLFVHVNALYHMPQIRSFTSGEVKPEIYFNFTRYHSINLALGAEYHLGDVIPFFEFNQLVAISSGLSYFNSPSRISFGTRFTPIANKSLSFLLGADIGIGKEIRSGVPFTPSYQILGQVSYTVAITQTERKHYYTSSDINIVDRKFVIKKMIKFKIDSAELESSSLIILDQIAKVIKDNKISKLLIVGHTDSTASEGYNMKLSNARANSVKKYLISKGIAEEILLAQGYGKRRPIASNTTEAGRAQNRRVEFYVLE